MRLEFTNRERSPAFTLVELLVSMSVLVLMMLLITQMMSNTFTVIGLSSKHMDTDAQARSLLDHMATDFAQLVQRTDVDYYLKDDTHLQTGESDQLAVYSGVAGYGSGSRSPVSLVGYRLNTSVLPGGGQIFQMERLGKGLVWNGSASTTDTPLVYLPFTIALTWPAATKTPTTYGDTGDPAYDEDYELVGPQVFRFEYYYILKGQAVFDATTNGMNNYPSVPSAVPWDTRIPGHATINGLQDVAAIAVDIAVIDPRSRVLVTSAQLNSLAGKMNDFNAATMGTPGALETQWQGVVDDLGNGVPRLGVSGIRIYHRYFSLANTP